MNAFQSGTNSYSSRINSFLFSYFHSVKTGGSFAALILGDIYNLNNLFPWGCPNQFLVNIGFRNTNPLNGDEMRQCWKAEQGGTSIQSSTSCKCKIGLCYQTFIYVHILENFKLFYHNTLHCIRYAVMLLYNINQAKEGWWIGIIFKVSLKVHQDFVMMRLDTAVV